VHYFRARAAVKAFDQFSELVNQYWQALPSDNRAYFWSGERPESADSFALRQRIHWALPSVVRYANELGVDTTFSSGSRALGYQRLNGLAAITEDEAHTLISRPHIVDLLTRCSAAAHQEMHRSFRRLVIPVYWLVDIPALVIRWPFLVLQAARLPTAWENSAAGQLIKVLELLALVGIAAYFGLRLDAVAKTLGR
jgi:hypothetical protein